MKLFGKNFPRLALGLAALGRPGYINLGHADDLEHTYDESLMQARAHAVLNKAYEQGVRYFDAARSYGKSEQFLASWLKESKPKDVLIGSKWGYTYTANWQTQAEKHEIKDHSLDNLKKQFPESQLLLGEHLNLYQIHSATLDTAVLKNEAVFEELFRLKQKGLKIGLSLSGEQQAETLELALQVFLEGERLFDTVQATFNLFERSAQSALALAYSEGMQVIIKEALANGRLSSRNTQSEAQPLLAHAARLNTNPDTLALAWVLQHNWVNIVLSGAATNEHLLSNLAALELKLDNESLAELNKLSQPSEHYWKVRSKLAWN